MHAPTVYSCSFIRPEWIVKEKRADWSLFGIGL
jgi:hypothetical protein